MTRTKFHDDLESILLDYRKSELREGTVGIGIRCAFSCLGGRISRLPSAPKGTNGAYFAMQTMREVIEANPTLRKYYYPQP